MQTSRCMYQSELDPYLFENKSGTSVESAADSGSFPIAFSSISVDVNGNDERRR